MHTRDQNRETSPSRRGFIKTTAAVVAGGSLAAGLKTAQGVHTAGSETLKIGLVGCGGRGRGAAVQALKADPNTRLVALADAFPDQVERSLKLFGDIEEIEGRVDTPPERCFSGFDAYQKLLETDVDVVLLAAPPHFRPRHLAAAVDAGKHIFAEKPVAVDAGGVKKILAACELAKQNNLAVVSGLCWRYENRARASMAKVHDGAVGKIVAMHSAYNASLPGKEWPMRRESDWGDLEFQLRNWYWFTWLSGDHIVEQAIHSIDKAAWAMHDEPPKSALSLGGLQSRQADDLGTIFDHHAVLYEYPNGMKHFHYCRQQVGCTNGVSTQIVGETGVCDVESGVIRDHDGQIVWRYAGDRNVMHQQEHDEMFASIRSGQPINNGLYMANSTMQAILGRMASYTGQRIGWDEAMNSKEDFSLARYDWDAKIETPPIAVPGVTPFV